MKIARIGLGLNVCNRVPKEGIALAEIIQQRNSLPLLWTVEVLLALDRAMNIVKCADFVCEQAEKRLWAKTINDSNSREWDIEGIDISGGLRLRKGLIQTICTRWS